MKCEKIVRQHECRETSLTLGFPISLVRHSIARTAAIIMSRLHNVLALFALLALAGAANAATTPEGVAYLQANKLKDGVVELPSGLQYRVLVDGPAGGPSPAASTTCSCHYRGTTIDGKEFDSSYKRGKPIEFAPNQVIAGWTEAMQMMKEGDKWELVIPSEIAYGDRQMGPDITPGAVLVFTLEIVKVGA